MTVLGCLYMLSGMRGIVGELEDRLEAACREIDRLRRILASLGLPTELAAIRQDAPSVAMTKDAAHAAH